MQTHFSVRNAPVTLHNDGAFHTKEIHLLTGDKSLSIKNSGRGYLKLSHAVFISDIHCSTEGTGGYKIQLRACTALCGFECTYEIFWQPNTEWAWKGFLMEILSYKADWTDTEAEYQQKEKKRKKGTLPQLQRSGLKLKGKCMSTWWAMKELSSRHCFYP